MKWTLVVGVVVSAFTLSVGCGGTSDTVDATPMPEIAARDIFAAYTANEVAADERFKGKTMVVNGTVGRIGKDVMDTPFLTLDNTDGAIFSVQAMFPNEATSALAQIEQGKYVRVRCEVDGKLGNVILRKCALQQ